MSLSEAGKFNEKIDELHKIVSKLKKRNQSLSNTLKKEREQSQTLPVHKL